MTIVSEREDGHNNGKFCRYFVVTRYSVLSHHSQFHNLIGNSRWCTCQEGTRYEASVLFNLRQFQLGYFINKVQLQVVTKIVQKQTKLRSTEKIWWIQHFSRYNFAVNMAVKTNKFDDKKITDLFAGLLMRGEVASGCPSLIF